MNKNHERLGFGLGTILLILTVNSLAAAQVWTELAPTGSPPLQTSQIANYDPGSNRLIVYFPGNPAINAAWSNQIWLLTNANGLGGTPAWMQLSTIGTPPTMNIWGTANYDATTNRLIIYGGGFGFTSPALADVFVLSNANGLGGPSVWSQQSVTNPQVRVSHSAVYNSSSNQLITFGGGFAFFGTDTNDTRSLSNANGDANPSTWTTVAAVGSLPDIREGHSAVYDETNDRMMLIAGTNAASCCYNLFDYNDAWVLTNASGIGGTPAWSQLVTTGGPPTPRGLPSTAYDSVNNRVLMFGGTHWDNGVQAYTKLGDLWELSNANGQGGAPAWTQMSQAGDVPAARYSAGVAFDSANQRLILVGGVDANDQLSNRVWVLSFNRAPVAACQDVTVSAGANNTVNASIDNGSFDPDSGDTTTLTQTPPGPYAIGQTNVTLTVADNHGATSSCQATVTVLYSFTGFLAPVDNLPVINLANAGSAIPIKFSLDGYKGLNIFAAGSPASQQIACSTGLPVSTIDATLTAGSSALSYNSSTDQYSYVWKTEKSWKGSCRQLLVRLNDGSTYAAMFQFK